MLIEESGSIPLTGGSANPVQRSCRTGPPVYRTRICKRLWSSGIDSEESITTAYVARRAGTKNTVVVPARQAGNRFLVSLKGLQIPAVHRLEPCSLAGRCMAKCKKIR
jgi:hypothetical protein